MDLLQREGKYPLPPQAPSTLGVEFSGTIVTAPSTDTTKDSVERPFKEGDAVFGLAYGGAYAEYVVCDARMIMHKPDSLSFEQAAGVPEAWITATQALFFVGEFKKAEKVLLHAGASGVSIAAIQLARRAGAEKVYVTAGSQEKIDFCVNELGADAGFNYKTQDWADEILKVTEGKGVDVIVDYVVGQGYLEGDLKSAAMDGRIVILAVMGGLQTKGPVDAWVILKKRLRIEGSTLRSRSVEYQEELRERLAKEAIPGFEDGTLKVFVEKVFDWNDVSFFPLCEKVVDITGTNGTEQIVEAHQLMESNQTKGTHSLKLQTPYMTNKS